MEVETMQTHLVGTFRPGTVFQKINQNDSVCLQHNDGNKIPSFWNKMYVLIEFSIYLLKSCTVGIIFVL